MMARFILFMFMLVVLHQKCYGVVPSHLNVRIKGFGVTVNGDTVRGYFNVMNDKYVYYSITSDGDRKEFPLNYFKSVYLELKSKKILNDNNLIEYDYIEQYQALYRKIFMGRRVYYDKYMAFYSLNMIFGVLIMDPIKDSFVSFPLVARATKKQLTDYLNKSYQTSFRYKDFKNSIDVIKEIEKH